MVASGPGKLLLELESRGGVQVSSQTLGNPRVHAKRREQRLSALAVYQCVGQFRGQNISSPGRARTSDTRINSPLLCRLSYRGIWSGYLSRYARGNFVPEFTLLLKLFQA